MLRERSDVQSMRATNFPQRDVTAGSVGPAVAANYGGCPSRLMGMVEEQGNRKDMDPMSSSSGVTAKLRQGELHDG